MDWDGATIRGAWHSLAGGGQFCRIRACHGPGVPERSISSSYDRWKSVRGPGSDWIGLWGCHVSELTRGGGRIRITAPGAISRHLWPGAGLPGYGFAALPRFGLPWGLKKEASFLVAAVAEVGGLREGCPSCSAGPGRGATDAAWPKSPVGWFRQADDATHEPFWCGDLPSRYRGHPGRGILSRSRKRACGQGSEAAGSPPERWCEAGLW